MTDTEARLLSAEERIAEITAEFYADRDATNEATAVRNLARALAAAEHRLDAARASAGPGLREACKAGCFSGGCGTCWGDGCDHHAAAEPALDVERIRDIRLLLIDGIATDLSREFAQGDPFEPFDRIYIVKRLTRVLGDARERVRLAAARLPAAEETP